MNLFLMYTRSLLFGILLFLVLQLNAKTTTWLGGGGTWDVPTAWSDGLPLPGDSAIISGVGSNVVILSGTIVHLAYLKIADEATLLIENAALLEVYNTVTNGLIIRDGSTLTNRGSISIPRSGNRGIHMVSGTLINEDYISVDSSSTALSMQVLSMLENNGEIYLKNGFFGLFIITESSVENNGFIDVSQCTQSLDVRHECFLENQNIISVSEGTSTGFYIYGEVVNNGSIFISDMLGQSSIAMQSDSFSCCDTFYIGRITNNGLIDIDDVGGDGVHCAASTTFFNLGAIRVTDCSGKGILLRSLARFRVDSGGELVVTASSDPITIEQECDFIVEIGGIVDASMLDTTN